MLGLAPGCGDGTAIRHPIPTDTVLWLVGDNISGNDGDAIGTWPDHNGGNSFTQATGGLKPLLKTGANGINGHSVALFDGVDDTMTASAISVTGKAMTIILVVKQGVSLADEKVVIASSPGIWSCGNGGGGTNVNSLGRAYSGPGLGANDVTTGALQWTTYLKDSTGWTVSTSVAAIGTVADTTDVNLATPVLGIFPTLSDFDGKMAEIIIWNRTLTAPEVLNVQLNLSAKYGIT